MDQIVKRDKARSVEQKPERREPGKQETGRIVTESVKQSAPSAQEALGLGGGRRRKKGGKGWLFALAAIAVVAGGVGYWQFGGTGPVVTYVTVPVERSNITVEVSATGTLQPLIQVDISSELSGVMRTVLVDENQLVKQGDVLAELDTTRLEAQIAGAKASVKSAEAKILEAKTTVTEAEQAFARSEQLLKRGMAAQQTLDTATATRDRAHANVAMAEANLAIAEATMRQQEADLVKSRIYAPIDGIVLTRSVNPGQTVASSMQAPVLFVLAANLENMELEAAIDEADIGSVKGGQSARFTVDAFPERTFTADIRDISFASVTTEGVVTYTARLDVDNSELLLRPGMTTTVSIVTRQADNVLTVPGNAFRFSPATTETSSGFSLRNIFAPPRMGPSRMMRQPGGRNRDEDPSMRTLYVLKGGAPEAVRVKTGATDGDAMEIVSGLDEGDLVITASRTGTAQARR